METAGLEPASLSVQATGAFRKARPRDPLQPHEGREADGLVSRRLGSLKAQGFLLPVDDRVRTGGVEPPQPEAARLQRAELTRAQRPHVSGAGGIRTHGLELMRLARTASPLPRS